jgi:hypothetical protein
MYKISGIAFDLNPLSSFEMRDYKDLKTKKKITYE